MLNAHTHFYNSLHLATLKLTVEKHRLTEVLTGSLWLLEWRADRSVQNRSRETRQKARGRGTVPEQDPAPRPPLCTPPPSSATPMLPWPAMNFRKTRSFVLKCVHSSLQSPGLSTDRTEHLLCVLTATLSAEGTKIAEQTQPRLERESQKQQK